MAFDVYVSHAEEDKQWVTELVDEIEDNCLSVCLRSRNFDGDLSLIENRKMFVEQCSSCILVFSKHYCKKASEWSYFTKFIKSKDDKSISGFLDNKGILCVYLSDCNIPDLFKRQKMLDWTAQDLRDVFWQRLIKFLKVTKKKSDIKKALSPKIKLQSNSEALPDDCFNNNHSTDAMQNNQENSHVQNRLIEDLSIENDETSVEQNGLEHDDLYENDDNDFEASPGKMADYILFDNVYPHLVSSSFNAEDEDLTKEEVENLTLKMEDVNTIMLLNENNTSTTGLDSSTPKKYAQKAGRTLDEFATQHEQMELLDALQTVNEKFQMRFDVIMLQKNIENVAYLDLKKKRYRRLLKNFQDCLVEAFNGKKDTPLINSLPLVLEMLEDRKDIHGFRCHCCDGLYHSERALHMHLEFCVKQQWKELMKFIPNNSISFS